MKRLAEKEQSIRGYVNDAELYDRHFKVHSDDWNRLTAAMDVLGDTCIALMHFEENGIGEPFGENYLRLYGLFQAVILQQDAIQSLFQLIVQSTLSYPAGSFWKQIRDLRNMVAGHPLDKRGAPQQGDLRIFISRISITSNSFDLMICEELTGNIKSQPIGYRTIYEEYKIEALDALSTIENAQIKRWGPLS